MLKRRVRIVSTEEYQLVWRVELSEQRTIVLPWLRLPLWTYWRKRIVHTLSTVTADIVARTFLETGHVPAQWFL